MKTSELRKKSLADLNKMVEEYGLKVINHKKAIQLGELTDHSQVGKSRKDLARLMTVISEKEKENV